MKNMNLTNMFKSSNIFTDPVQSFSKYISQQDKYDLPPFETSFNSQTLLIESTPIPQKNSFCLSSVQSKKQSFILKNDKENKHYYDVNQEFQITINDHFKDKHQRKSTTNLPLEDICGYLIQTVKDLEAKIENLRNKQKIDKKLTDLKDFQVFQKSKNVSFLNSTKQTEKQRNQKFQGCCKYKDFMQLAVENIENKVKVSIYKQQMQNTQRQLTKFQLLNEQYKREIQKLKGQNIKFRQLIKQYQLYNRRNLQKINQNLKNDQAQFKNKQNKGTEQFQSQQRKKIDQRENSLDQKLQQNQYLNIKKLKKIKFYSPDALRKIENSQIFIRQTPKTPQLIFRKLRQDTQKTQLKSKHRSCNGILKQIIQFEQKNQRGIESKRNGYPLQKIIQKDKIQNKYPNDYLLQSQFENNNDNRKQFMSLSNFQTMESLQEIIQKGQSKINAQGVNQKYLQTKY